MLRPSVSLLLLRRSPLVRCQIARPFSLWYNPRTRRPAQLLSSSRRLSASTVVQTRNCDAVYDGPLTSTFRRLKIFSLSSLTLSFTLSPFIFVVESNLPWAARLALAATALGTSGISTALVAWCGRPYVTTLRKLDPKDNDGFEGLEMTTLTLGLHKRVTRVYDTGFLVETKRPFAKWELALNTCVTEPGDRSPAGQEETIAETMNDSGKVIGRWVVQWGENGQGICKEVGKVVRFFNVHEELLH